MPGYDRLGHNQRVLLIQLRDGATLTHADGAWQLNGGYVKAESCASLYARGYLMFDEHKNMFVLTLKGRRS